MLWASRIWAKSSRSSPVPCTTTVVSFSRHFELLESMHVEARVCELVARGERIERTSVAVRNAFCEVDEPCIDQAGFGACKKRLRCRMAELVNPRHHKVLDSSAEPVLDVPDEDPASFFVVLVSALGSRLPTEQRGYLGVFLDLAGKVEAPVLAQDVGWVPNEPSILGRLVSEGISTSTPLVAIRVRIGSGLSLKWDRMRRRGRPRVQVVEPQMVVKVDQAGEHKVLAAKLDHARVADGDAWWLLSALPDGDDLAAAYEDASIRDHAVSSVHRDDGGASDQDPAKRRPGLDPSEGRRRARAEHEQPHHDRE